MGFYYDGSGQHTYRPGDEEIAHEEIEPLRPSPGKSSSTHGGAAMRGIPGKVSLTARMVQRMAYPSVDAAGLQLLAGDPALGGPLPRPSAPGTITHEVVVNVVLLEPAHHRIGADIAVANELFGRHGIRVRRGSIEVIPAAETEDMLSRPQGPPDPNAPPGQPPAQEGRLDEGSPPSITRRGTDEPEVHRARASEEVRELLSRNRTPGVPTAYWLPANTLTNDRRTGFSYTSDVFENILDQEGLVVTENAARDVFAHELLHLLARADHDDLEGHQGTDVPAENLAYPTDTVESGPNQGQSRGGELTEAQVQRIMRSRYVRPVVSGTPPAQSGTQGPQLRAQPGTQQQQVAGSEAAHEAAARGISSGGAALPFGPTIQRAFGSHDISNIRSHAGSEVEAACDDLGALAYAFGTHVAFRGTPDLHTAAHEATHVVQQRAGVSLPNGVGSPGDVYERHADAVADAVVRGESVEAMLGEPKNEPASAQPQAIQGDWPDDQQSEGRQGGAARGTWRITNRADALRDFGENPQVSFPGGSRITRAGRLQYRFSYQGRRYTIVMRGAYFGVMYGGNSAGTLADFDELIADPRFFDDDQRQVAIGMRPQILSEGAVDSINTYDNQLVTLAGRGNGQAENLVHSAIRLAREYNLPATLDTAIAHVQTLRTPSATGEAGERFNMGAIHPLITTLAQPVNRKALTLAKINDGMMRFVDGNAPAPDRNYRSAGQQISEVAAETRDAERPLDPVIIGIATHLNIGSPRRMPDPHGAAQEANTLYPQRPGHEPRDFERLSAQAAHVIKIRAQNWWADDPVVLDYPAGWIFQKTADFNNHFQHVLAEEQWGDNQPVNERGRRARGEATSGHPERRHNFFVISAAAAVIPCWTQINSLHASSARPAGVYLQVAPGSTHSPRQAGNYYDFGDPVSGARTRGGSAPTQDE